MGSERGRRDRETVLGGANISVDGCLLLRPLTRHMTLSVSSPDLTLPPLLRVFFPWGSRSFQTPQVLQAAESLWVSRASETDEELSRLDQ